MIRIFLLSDSYLHIHTESDCENGRALLMLETAFKYDSYLITGV